VRQQCRGVHELRSADITASGACGGNEQFPHPHRLWFIARQWRGEPFVGLCTINGREASIQFVTAGGLLFDTLELKARSVPFPFFHGVPEAPPEKGDRHRRPPEIAPKNRTSTEPVPIFGLPHLRFELLESDVAVRGVRDSFLARRG